MGVPLFGYNVSRGTLSGLNSGVTGLCFDLKLRKCSEDLFFFFFFLVATKENWSLSQKIFFGASLETLREDPTVRVRNKQAVWKLLSKISRTAPAANAEQRKL